MAALITLEDYKIYKKLSKTDSDEQLSSIIASVSGLVKTYCGHSFIDYYTTPKVEIFNVNPSQHAILLNEWPVKQVTSVETRASYSESYSILPDTEYFVDSTIDTIFKHDGYWDSGFGAVKVTYTAGYSSTPDDVQVACLDLVNHYFKEEYTQRKTIGTSSLENTQASSKWPAHIVRVLDLYRNG